MSEEITQAEAAVTEENPNVQKAAYTLKQPRFIIRCQKCRWAVVNNGTSPELKAYQEIPHNCQNCGKPRQFRCPACGRVARMTRVKGA